jgi:hypothetical protein
MRRPRVLQVCLLTNPIWLIKTRMQLQSKAALEAGVPVYTGLWDAVQQIGRADGFRGYYRGLGPSLVLVGRRGAGRRWWGAGGGCAAPARGGGPGGAALGHHTGLGSGLLLLLPLGGGIGRLLAFPVRLTRACRAQL